jgi:hypothetical protein
MSRPENTIRPLVALYRPVSMLKNVVFPAPLGPMIETIDPTGMSIETSLTARNPPNSFVTPSAARIASVEGP